MKSFILTLMSSLAFASATPLSDIPFKKMDGTEASLKDYAGKVVLIVNVASRCGNTQQYPGLEALYQKYQSQGFIVLGFPCNDFGSQEPGTNAEIQEFCSTKFQITFPLLDKIHVKGPEQCPLYAALSGPAAKIPGDIKWNFGKFLIGKNGEVLARFEPGIKPESPELITAIETALK